ncbi:hypothetical protein SISSUDRAFT_646729 [Sistotremastrum suecicum HHB10207 ss-3]|uniref:NACHT domain-containing protein n=1 Tax=Sistotremastrum suecicum HHB10207 ss-3 TaxID=1314776 RepID=A0A166EAM1_9AGAM|nr:hypothetical protein SISSUDRAFT_646729 [Sistotremastrum suecicum HHB10207 ss-3]
MAASATHDESESMLVDEDWHKNTLVVSNVCGTIHATTRQRSFSLKKRSVLLVEFEYGGRKERTAYSGNTRALSWTDELTFPCSNTSTGEVLKIRVFYQKKGKDKPRCEAEDVVQDLDESKPLDRMIRVWKCADGTASDLHLRFRLTISRLAPDALEPAASNRVALPTVSDPSPAIEHAFDMMDCVVDGADAMQPIGESLVTVIESVDPIFQIIENISEVHPYAKLAFSILTAACKVLKAQRDRDNKVNVLIIAMKETYESIWTAKWTWQHSKTLDSVWDKVSQVTMDCCNFILKYRKTKTFTLRVLRNVASKTDETIKKFEGQFQDIKTAFQALTVENIRAAVMEIKSVQLESLDDVQNLHVQINLNDMIYPRGANFDPKKACLPGTREHALYTLQKFASGLAVDDQIEANPSVLWIKGAAGTGKSFIAHRLVQVLSPHAKVGSSFFFNYRTRSDAPPHSLIPRISQDLASVNPAWKLALTSIIGKDRSLRHETSILQQFETLLIQPALAVFIPQPILFVIDGLDEAGDWDERSELLEVLTTRLHELPSNFRFVLLSRPERDIVDAFSSSPYHISLDMKNLCSHDDDDVTRLVEHRFKDLKAEPKNRGWLTDDALSALVLKSGGLMIFAGTACDYITVPAPGWTPEDRLRQILEFDELPRMNSLYTVILEANVGSDIQALAHFQTIMGRMVCLRTPLTYDSYRALDYHSCCQKAMETILPFMASLLHGVHDHTSPISPIHKSLTDFLIDKDRSLKYHVDGADHHRPLLEGCLNEMAKNLRFNVYGVESSNDVVLDKRQHTISRQLQYACQFWAIHLSQIPYDLDIATQIKSFFEQKLLHWLEVLNCIEYSESIAALVAGVIRWSQWDDVELTDISTEVEACLHQTSAFKPKSGPHVYLSTLPYVAPTNWIHRHYRHLLDRIPVVTSELLTEHSSLEITLFHLVRDGTDIVQAQYSPNGGHILALNGPLFVLFDATSYMPIWKYDRLSATKLFHWQFSPDGSCIYLLGQDLELAVVQVMDGTCRSPSIKIHSTEDVIRAIISPDCSYVICVTKQGTHQKWCTQTGQRIISSILADFELFEEKDEIALSPDGDSVLRWGGERSGYQIGCWCAGAASPSILKGHTARIRCAIRSIDKTRIFSSDDDCTIRAWYLVDGREIWQSGVHVQHAYSGHCLAASPNKQLVASGSQDETVRIWDATTGRLLCKPLHSQHGSPENLEFSPDGEQLICITSEGIVYVWNVELALSAPLHYAFTSRVVFGVQISPDSSLIAVAVGSDVIQIKETKSAKVLARKSVRSKYDFYRVLAFSPENSILAYADDTHCIGLWHWQTPERDDHLYDGHHIRSLCFSPNAELLLSASDDKTIRVWNIRSANVLPLRVIHTNRESSDYAFAAVFANGGNRIVSAHFFDNSIKVWDLEAEDPLKQRIEWPPDQDVRLALSPNGRRLVSASKQGIQL